jgi:uncharacterized YigZ family protein
MATYFSPVDRFEYEIEVKKSRFIATAIPLSSTDALYQLQSEMQRLHPKASHHCVAYILGAPQAPKAAGSSDDGEPSGTAGKPMLNILMHKNLGDIGVVVTRYFGGTKLGAGGLIRAYGASVSELSVHLPTIECAPKIECQIRYPYELEADIQQVIAAVAAEELSASYTEIVDKTLLVELAQLETFNAAILALEYRGVELTVEA